MNDSQVSQVLDAVLAAGVGTSVTRLSLEVNLLTRVPRQLPLFPRVEGVFLSNNRQIHTYHSGDFHFTTVPRQLYLYNSCTSCGYIPITIEPGTFQGLQLLLH
jgi:hypothetical protein